MPFYIHSQKYTIILLSLSKNITISPLGLSKTLKTLYLEYTYMALTQHSYFLQAFFFTRVSSIALELPAYILTRQNLE